MSANIRPDIYIEETALKDWGYTWDGMLPLTPKKARKLREDANLSICAIYGDDTEAVLEIDEDFYEALGDNRVKFGIEKDDWEWFLSKKLGNNLAFLELCEAGILDVSQIDDVTEYWHENYEGNLSLREFLGMSTEQYSKWLADENFLEENLLAERD